MVRHGTLDPVCAGPIPATPAKYNKRKGCTSVIMSNIYLFLDVDGVLNSYEHPGMIRYTFGLSEYPLVNLSILQKATNAKIVISSTWRLLDERIQQLKDAGIQIYDVTPSHLISREQEILVWRRQHMLDDDWGIIVDDDTVLSAPVNHMLEFKTTTEKGLTLDIVNAIISLVKDK